MSANRQVRLRHGTAGVAGFALHAAAPPVLVHGTFLAQVLWLGLDAFSVESAGAGSAVDEVVPAQGVARVIDSRHEVFGVGSYVVLDCGLQELCVSDGAHARLLHPGQTPHSSALGVLGRPGMAAYFGLLELAALQPGETVLVSDAADAAGATAGQLAQLKGARALGLAATREQCEWVRRHGRFTACLQQTPECAPRLRALAPRGIDVFFDSHGAGLPEALAAAGVFAPHARIVQNRVRPADTAALHAHAPQLSVRRIDARSYEARRGEFLREVIPWHGAGRIALREDVVEGLEAAPSHLERTLKRLTLGRALVRVPPRERVSGD
ncbi:MAG: hypothetical protein JO341_02485 [Gammaproteobacteria bacterium]|nr:hypothetical protein [Gammaproteobacteria bacterium]